MNPTYPATLIKHESTMKTTAPDAATEISTFRLYLLRAMYAFMFVGLALAR